MEEGLNLLEQIKKVFTCGEQDVRAYSPLTLAYIGDAVYELVIRSVVVERANRSANDLHKMSVRYVKAEAQAKEYGHSFERELAYLVTHGMLHLLGYDHMIEEEKAQMMLKTLMAIFLILL